MIWIMQTSILATKIEWQKTPKSSLIFSAFFKLNREINSSSLMNCNFIEMRFPSQDPYDRYWILLFAIYIHEQLAGLSIILICAMYPKVFSNGKLRSSNMYKFLTKVSCRDYVHRPATYMRHVWMASNRKLPTIRQCFTYSMEQEHGIRRVP